jgi:hypothetical protein
MDIANVNDAIDSDGDSKNRPITAGYSFGSTGFFRNIIINIDAINTVTTHRINTCVKVPNDSPATRMNIPKVEYMIPETSKAKNPFWVFIN